MASNIRLKLKLMVNKSTNKVLFAEASKDVVDLLFGLLEMPICSIFTLLKKEKVAVGSLGLLFKSFEDLDVSYFHSFDVKSPITYPDSRCSSVSNSFSLLRSPATKKKTCYECPSSCQTRKSKSTFVSDSNKAICPKCSEEMSELVHFVEGPVDADQPVGYVKFSTFVIHDNLTVAPGSGFSVINHVLKNSDVGVIGDLEEMVVTFDFDSCLKLLKASLRSTTVLSDVFLSVPPEQSAAK